MYAIVDIAGKQYKAEKDKFLYVPLREAEIGEKLCFGSVLLVENEGDVKVGAPIVKNASVDAEVLEHMKDDKVVVFKKKRRKGYRIKNGHRQKFSKVLIKDITV